MSDLEFTGERLVPDISPADLEAEHRARYEFATRFIEGRKILDVGCGAGYGSYMMSTKAGSVTGIDIDQKAVEFAKKNYEHERVSFVNGDVRSLPFGDDEFSMCVCFEVIEHIKEPDKLLSEVSRVLGSKDDKGDPGLFIVSTPNGGVKVSSKPNPFHVKEFSLGEFRALLNGYFPAELWTIDIYGQFVRGKNYSAMNVMLKNVYLSFKGMLGIKPAEKPSGSQEKNKLAEFEFERENAQLAEYLVAVIRAR